MESKTFLSNFLFVFLLMHFVNSENTNMGASTTYSVQVSALHQNHYVMLDGRPCKIEEMETTISGNINIIGTDIFTNERHDGSFGPDSNVEVPNVTYKDFTVIGINEDGFLSLLDDDGVTYDDLKVPMGTLGDNIREAFENGKEVPVTAVYAVAEAAVVAMK